MVSACSDEEQPYPEESASIRKPITTSPSRKKIESMPQIQGVESAGIEEEVETNSIIPDTKPDRQAVMEEKAEKEVRYYTVKKGDTLFKIAGQPDVFGDSMKWPILYRLNAAKLEKLGDDDETPEKQIAEGIKLQISASDEVAEKIKNRNKEYWVINVQSSPKKERIIPNAIKLIKKGYPVYLTHIKVDNKDWIRLRVGFFKEKEEADTEGKKLIKLMNISDIWVTRAGENEIKEFIGYL